MLPYLLVSLFQATSGTETERAFLSLSRMMLLSKCRNLIVLMVLTAEQQRLPLLFLLTS